MYKNCTVCIAVQISIHSLRNDLRGMCLGRPSAAGLPTVLTLIKHRNIKELFIHSLKFVVFSSTS